MKKVLAITTLAVLCLSFGLVQAGPDGGKKTDGSSASATKSACSGDVTAKLAGSKAACSAHGDVNGTPEECAAMKAKYGDKCEIRTISIKGMTCGSCENTVTAALKDVEGVIKVIKVSYKDEIAVVCIDKTTAKSELLTKAVSNKGFKAEIINAVATTGTTNSKASCASKTGAEKKGCCASKSKTTKASGDPQ